MLRLEDILGQEHIKEYFNSELMHHQISHAYILTGEAGMGRKTIANAFAMAIECEEEGVTPCMQCRSCRQFMSGTHPDVVYVRHSKPGSIGIDDVREQIINDVAIKPYYGPYKIYIVDQAELMTVQAQNALLKTIEEPPQYAVLFLLTTDLAAFLPTITSRCVNLKLKPLYDKIIKDHLVQEYRVPERQADVITAFARGNLGKAIALAGSEEFAGMQEAVLGILKHVREMNIADMQAGLRQIREAGYDIMECLDMTELWFRDILMFKATQDTVGFVFKDEYRYIKDIADRTSFEGIEKILKAVDTARIRINANVDLELAMELMLLAIKENIL